MRTVGILGGMGPEATVDLMRRVIAGTPAQDDADHVPLIVDQNTQVPSRIAHLIDGTGEDPGPVLIAMAQRLEAAGAQALAMPCNTAHHYAEQIEEAVGIPLLNMVELTVTEAEKTGETVIGLLGSPAIKTARIYADAFGAHGLRMVYPADQEAMLTAIRQIKTHGPNETSASILRAASDSMDTPVQILACTEFSLIADALPDRITTIDTLDVLTGAIIRFATEG
ncbi:aspartate/glutamate racemase family protein [Flavimaricola marinus]|uniref:Aspartate racemase n=1 Tax=Flavimaricola marinus TaxID=1819565 RepID=A0A238LAD7_9RHOB|nr:amino acid racemase [Flavimaricola marinus]SMY06687.1 Aspartate racemase [Flavimaricola marinus]